MKDQVKPRGAAIDHRGGLAYCLRHKQEEGQAMDALQSAMCRYQQNEDITFMYLVGSRRISVGAKVTIGRIVWKNTVSWPRGESPSDPTAHILETMADMVVEIQEQRQQELAGASKAD